MLKINSKLIQRPLSLYKIGNQAVVAEEARSRRGERGRASNKF